jgi:hypothetical protein
VNAYYAQFEPGAEGTVDAVAESPEEPLLEAETSGAPAPSEAESETGETASVAAGNAAEEKKEFDTIENSEGVG